MTKSVSNTLTQAPTVGQVVRFVGKSTCILTPGKEYAVVKLDIDGYAVILDNHGEDTYVWEGTFNMFELVAEESKSTFQVGDKVRMIDNDVIAGAGQTENGEIYDVIEIHEDGDISIDDKTGGQELVIWKSEMRGIEKVEGKVAEEKKGETKVYKFKAGDKVELLDNRGALGGFVKGNVYPIVAINHGGYHDYELRTPVGISGFANESSLKLAVELKPLTKMPKAGDVVRASRVERDSNFVTIDKDYTILGVSEEGNAFYEGDDGITTLPGANIIKEWFLHEFDLVSESSQRLTEMPKVGDVIRYVSNEDRVGLTTGKTYEIIEVDEDGDANFVSDFGDDFFGGLASVRTFTLENYELVSEAPQELEVLPELTVGCDVGNALEARVEALEARLHALETGNVDIVGTKIEQTEKGITMSAGGFRIISDTLTLSGGTPNQKRKQAIENAEASLTKYDHIGGITNRGGFKVNGMGSLCDAEFIIDEKRGTVKCILTEQLFGRVHAEAIAKCDPTDVFNVTLGKAIALGRARGADVTEFAMAPQPTVAVGQKVDILRIDGVTKTDELGLEVVSITDKGFPKFADGMFASHFVITNDSDAKY